MPTLVPKGRGDDYPALEVSDDQVEFWKERGYVEVGGKAPAKKAASKTAAKKSS